jgi:hypothetical protein
MKEQRNELVMEALEDENLHTLVEANNCIHVKNSHILRKPKDLVFEKGWEKILTKKYVFGNYLTI